MCKSRSVYDSFVLSEVFLMPTVKTVPSLHFLQLTQIPELCCRQKLQHPSNVKTWILFSSCQKKQLYYIQCLILQPLFIWVFYLIKEFDTDALESKLLRCNYFLQGDREQGFQSTGCTSFACISERYFMNLLHPRSHGRYILLPTPQRDVPFAIRPSLNTVLKPLL